MGTNTRPALAAMLACFLASHLPLLAQEAERSQADSRFLLTGYGFATYVDSDGDDGAETFTAGWTPIFLYRVTDRFLFEAEVEFELEEDQVETEIEYAQIDWLAHDNLTVVAGRFLTPFGAFIEKLHPAWINKLPTAPLPYRHGASLVPFNQTGIQLRGGVPFGDGYRRLTYSLFFSNGFQISEHGDDSEEEPAGEHEEEENEPMSAQAVMADEEHEEGEGEEAHGEEEGELLFLDGASSNRNGDTAIGGRISLIPSRGWEIGVSRMSGSYDPGGRLDADLTGVDLGYHHDLFDVRVEWLDTTTDLGTAPDGDPLGDQEVEAWYVQPSLRLSVVPVYAFNKLELVTRLAKLDAGDADEDQTSIGLNYYFTGSSVVRLAWERDEPSGHEAVESVQLMLALGF